ncbi:hypothetical protein JOE26_001497 [Rhodococcus coprophilus]|uniref:Uncharacterized protein n=1 Tax=Rhodococcus coprophilus TaxID=38310 RepID=A0A2X4XAM5_9NOCA|nr:hypothetical protein [Rhodococcus coprophilus]SQI33604.1 Uncharacterised protein [Rhodococcus coprophilus]
MVPELGCNRLTDGIRGVEKSETSQTRTDLLVEFTRIRGRRTRQGSQYDVGVSRHALDEGGTDMTKPARDSMSNHRRPDSLIHDEPETGTVDTHQELGPITLESVNHKVPPPLTATATDGIGKVRAAPQAIRLR